MQVVLVQNMSNLGKLGDTVNVKPGYARNYLLPQGIARRATSENLREIQARRAELERIEHEKFEAARQRQSQLEGRRVTIRAKVGPENKLFGSVSAGDIAEALSADGVAVEKRQLNMPQGPLREVGEFAVDVHVYGDMHAAVTVAVEGES
ncbi:MAG: 50S ribosomal protein L9 [Proteobacteria bacterium SW_6_67_9]|nr:MAG: 50S ribosomal protein L9 [Proteobacteria bacterium SW_6_67_9]